MPAICIVTEHIRARDPRARWNRQPNLAQASGICVPLEAGEMSLRVSCEQVASVIVQPDLRAIREQAPIPAARRDQRVRPVDGCIESPHARRLFFVDTSTAV